MYINLTNEYLKFNIASCLLGYKLKKKNVFLYVSILSFTNISIKGITFSET